MRKVKGKVLCIKDKPYHLTAGKWYNVLDENDIIYLVEDDADIKDNKWFYYKNENYFITEKELRKQKLQKINEKTHMCK
jgi:hypothetical protein